MLNLVGFIGKTAITVSFAIFLMFATFLFGLVTAVYFTIIKFLTVTKKPTISKL